MLFRESVRGDYSFACCACSFSRRYLLQLALLQKGSPQISSQARRASRAHGGLHGVGPAAETDRAGVEFTGLSAAAPPPSFAASLPSAALSERVGFCRARVGVLPGEGELLPGEDWFLSGESWIFSGRG